MITITGGNGKLGQIIIDGLLQSVSAQDIRAVVRNRDNGARFEELGIDVRAGDYTDLQSLVSAFDGSQTILLISSNALGQLLRIIRRQSSQRPRPALNTSSTQAVSTPTTVVCILSVSTLRPKR
jgi:uncharacterized protein YbjT (DUF2867 family)